MPVYRYQAVDKRGRTLSGLMPAHDESNLEQKLKALGLWLTEVDREQAGLPTDTLNASDVQLRRIRGRRHRRGTAAQPSAQRSRGVADQVVATVGERAAVMAGEQEGNEAEAEAPAVKPFQG